MKETIAKFNEKYPNVKVVHSANENYEQAYKLAFNSGSGPDISYLDDLNQQSLQKNGYLLDITEDVKRMGWLDKFAKGSAEFNNQRTPGQYYSMGFISYPRVLFYNKKIMDELNLTAPKTLEELEAQLPIIKEAGYIPWEASETHMLWITFSIVLNSVPMEDINKWYFLQETTPAFVEAYKAALTKVDEWVDKGYFRKEVLSMNSSDLVTPYTRGDTVFQLTGNSTAKKVEGLPFPIGVTAFPGKDPSVPPVLVSAIDGSWALKADIKPEKKQAALDFIDTFSDPEIAAKWMENGFTVTTIFDSSNVKLSPLQLETVNAVQGTQTGYFMDNAVPGLLETMKKLNQRLVLNNVDADKYWEEMNATYERLKKEYLSK